MAEEQMLYDREEIENPSLNGTEETQPTSLPVEYVDTDSAKELRTLISNISDVVEELIAIPEWQVNGKVIRILLRGLNAEQRASLIDAQSKPNATTANAYANIIIMSARHPKTKELLFANADRGMLFQRFGRAVERIALRVAEISGLSEKDLEELKKK